MANSQIHLQADNKAVRETETLKRYWQDPNLDDKEKFLREYVVSIPCAQIHIPLGQGQHHCVLLKLHWPYRLARLQVCAGLQVG